MEAAGCCCAPAPNTLDTTAADAALVPVAVLVVTSRFLASKKACGRSKKDMSNVLSPAECKTSWEESRRPPESGPRLVAVDTKPGFRLNTRWEHEEGRGIG